MDDPILDTILDSVTRRTGLRYRTDQRAGFAESIRRVMKRMDIATPPQFVQALEHDASVYNALVDEITVGETYFFREPKHFDFVVSCVVPEFQKHRGSAPVMRVWSAGCASGEEAYSLAVVFDQLDQPAEILATDISLRVLIKARQATYRDWSFRGQAADRVKNYVERIGEDVVLNESLRKKVHFQHLNLATDRYPAGAFGNFDLILCRNVLIYFGRETIDRIARQLYECLRPGGWLITASGDPSFLSQGNFKTQTTAYGTFYQRPDLMEPLASPQPGPSQAPLIVETNSLPRTRPETTRPRVRRDSVIAGESAPASVSKQIALATAALAERYYLKAIGLTEPLLDFPDACAIHVRARNMLDAGQALAACATAVEKHPLSVELHWLHAKLLLDTDQSEAALRSVQKALFLDRSQVMVHFLFGSVQLHRGKWESALRHFANARDLCSSRSRDEQIPFTRETAGEVATAAASQMNRVEAMLNHP